MVPYWNTNFSGYTVMQSNTSTKYHKVNICTVLEQTKHQTSSTHSMIQRVCSCTGQWIPNIDKKHVSMQRIVELFGCSCCHFSSYFEPFRVWWVEWPQAIYNSRSLHSSAHLRSRWVPMYHSSSKYKRGTNGPQMHEPQISNRTIQTHDIFCTKIRVTVLCLVASFTTFSSVGKPFRLRISSTNFPKARWVAEHKRCRNMLKLQVTFPCKFDIFDANSLGFQSIIDIKEQADWPWAYWLSKIQVGCWLNDRDAIGKTA